MTNLSQELESLHRRAIAEAPALLSAFEKEPGLLLESETPLRFSGRRGHLPVLVPEGVDPHSIDSKGIFVAANGGAQLQNSPVYLDRGEGSRQVVLNNAEGTAHSMLAYTLPEDTLVLASKAPAESEIALRRIGESYAAVGLSTTQRFLFIDCMDEWLGKNGGAVPVLPNIIEPALLVSYGRDAEHVRKLIRSGIVNIAAYTKDGAEISWRNHGIPTPPTSYHETTPDRISATVADIIERYRSFEHVVMSRLDGSGGFGIHLEPVASLDEASLARFGAAPIQCQGYLPLQDSPCVIANITPESCEILTASSQRFRRFGAHSGNLWTRDYLSKMDREVPGVTEVTSRALDHLRRIGVIGQVNIDLLIVSPETADRHSLPGRALLREANIRPAGSSILLRLMQGSLDGSPVETILTSSIRGVPQERIASGEISEISRELRDPGRKAVVLCNYSSLTRSATLAYLGAPGVEQEELAALHARAQARLRP